jgi:hypothetical protein
MRNTGLPRPVFFVLQKGLLSAVSSSLLVRAQKIAPSTAESRGMLRLALSRDIILVTQTPSDNTRKI